MIMRPKKSLGQNFLMHARIAERIAAVAAIDGQTVLEIGPGTGMLTRALLARAKKVIAVEADAELVAELEVRFSAEIKTKQFTLFHTDIRKFNLNLISRYSVKDGYHVVANIPYYLTGEIFRMFLSAAQQPSSMTLLVQKEVAERIARSRKESILSLSVKAYGEPKYEFTVPRGAFRPAPKVDSAVLSIRNISRTNFASTKEEEHFFALLHAGFAHKRKLLRNNLGELVEEKALRAAGVSEGTRAEDVPLPEWLALARVIC